MIQPPDSIITLAEREAGRSPCAKSKRGAAVFGDPQNGSSPAIYGLGFNGQPAPFACTGTAWCRELCGRLCEHAEARAIRQAAGSVFVTSGRAESGDHDLDLVHVKIGEDGKLVAGGPPSCWQCSRAILDCGFIAGVWLYEAMQGHSTYINEQGESCSAPVGMPVSVWRRYYAEEFHRTTLKNCGMEV